jgi:hypothetical protein
MWWMLSPDARSEGFKGRGDGPLIAGTSPVIALKAADKNLAIMVDLH